MKKYSLPLVLAGAVGSAISAQAAVDVTFNGTTYAVNTVTPTETYNAQTGYYYFTYPSGGLTANLFNTLTSEPWFGSASQALAFNGDYIAAVEAADPNYSTDGALQAAANVVFVDQAYSTPLSSSTYLHGWEDANNGELIFQVTPLNQPWTFAEATVVVPEAGSFGWTVAGGSLLFTILGLVRKSTKPVSA
jgi:hypothetical protein